MQQYDTALKATNTALHSQGSGYRENAEYLQSLEARINRLKNAWTELTLAFGDTFLTDTFVNILNALTGLASGSDRLVSTLGTLPPLLFAISAAMVLFRKSARTAAIESTLLDGAFRKMGISATFAKNAIRALAASTVVGLAFAGIGVVLELLISQFGQVNKEIETFSERINELGGQQTSLENLIREYEELNSTTNRTVEQQERLYEIQKEFVAQHGIVAQAINAEGEGYITNIALAKERVELLKEELQLQKERAVQEYREVEDSEIRKLEKRGKEQDKLLKQQKQLNEEITELEKQAESIKNSVDVDQAHLNMVTMQLQMARREQSNLQKDIEEKGLEYREQLNKIAKGNYDVIEIILSNLENGGAEVTDKTRAVIAQWARIWATEGQKIDHEIEELLATMVEKMSTLPEDANIDQLMRLFSSLGLSVDKNSQSYINFSQIIDDSVTPAFTDLGEEIDGVSDSMERQEETVDKLTSRYKNMVSEIELLDSVQKELDETNTISLDSVEKLNEKYADFVEITGLSIDKIREFVRDHQNKSIEAIKNERTQTERTIGFVEARIAAYEAESEAIRERNKERKTEFMGTASEFREQMFPYMDDSDAEKWMEDLGNQWDTQIGERESSDYEKQKRRLADLRQQLGMLDITISDIENRRSASSSSSSSKSAESRLNELNLSRELANSYRAEYEARNRIIDSIQRKIDLTDSDDTERLLDLQNKKLIEQEAAVEALREANDRLHHSANILRESDPRIDEWLDGSAEPTEAYIRHLESIHRNNALSIDQRNEMIQQTQSLLAEMQLLQKAHMSNTSEIISQTDAIRANYQEIERITQDHRQREFDISEEWIRREQIRMELAGASELEIARMVYHARVKMADESWTEIRNIAALSAKEQEEADYKAYQALQRMIELRHKLYKDEQKEIERLEEESTRERERIADQIVNIIRKQIEEEKKLRLRSLQEIEDAEKKRHDKRISQLDEEMKRFEEVINAQLQEIRRTEDTSDFEKERIKRQEEIQKLRELISQREVDDTAETQAAVRRLREDLAEREEDLAEFIHKRQISLREQNLQDNLESKRKEIDQERDAERRKFDNLTESLRLSREKIEEDYAKRLESERKFEELRQQIINGSVDEINAILTDLGVTIDTTMFGINETIKDNMVFQIEQATKAVEELDRAISKLETKKFDFDTNPAIQEAQAYEQYLRNKAEYHDIYSTQNTNTTRRQGELRSQNEQLRVQYGFVDYNIGQTMSELRRLGIAQFDTGGYTGNFKGGSFGILHEKELVLNKKDTSNLLQVINVTRDIVNRIQSNTSNSKGRNIKNRTESPVHQTLQFEKFIHIEKVDKDYDIDRFMKEADRKAKQMGFVVRKKR